jgi:hypothetical protein
MKPSFTLLFAALLSSLAGSVRAAATPEINPGAPIYDPAQLPAIMGKVAQYLLSPRGDVNGLLLEDGTEIDFPPHLSTAVVFAVKPGDSVTVHGLKARAIPVVQALSVTNDASGATVTDNGPGGGPPGAPRPDQELTASGKIKAQLHGPMGEINGVVLEDRTIVRMPPPEAARLVDTLSPGHTLAVRGTGTSGPLGTVIAAEAIGASEAQMTQLDSPPPHGPAPARRDPPPGRDAPPQR